MLGYKDTLAARGKAPSRAAKSTEYSKSQGDPSKVIHDGRSGEDSKDSKYSTIAPPIRIFHSIFDEFTQSLNDPCIQPTVDDLEDVHVLMRILSVIYKHEDKNRGEVHKRMGKILGTAISEMQNPDNTRPDGLITVELDNIHIPCALFELKREAGEGGCDPTTQASFSMRRAWIHSVVGYNRIHLDPAFDF